MSITKEEMAAKVVEPIRAAMAQGDLLWLRGWSLGAHNGLPFNPTKVEDRQPYRGGMNNILLMIASMINGYGDPRWMGYGQARKKGWHVKRGEASTKIYAPITRWITDDDGERRKVVTGFRIVSVFNAEQIEGIPALPSPEDLDVTTGYEAAEEIYKAVGIETTHGGNRASYAFKADTIQMPEPGAFKDADEYHATRLHEVGHATGHESRKDRGLFGEGIEAYAKEELVAELFAAFACADLGIVKTEMTQNHAAYLKSWHRRLGEKPELFVDAVNEAWKALEWVRHTLEDYQDCQTAEVARYADAHSDGGWK